MPALDSLLGSLPGCLDRFPDRRRGMNATYRIGDIGMAAFSVFFMQSPSFLAHQRQLEEGHGRSNCASLFGIAKIPSDNHIRDMLDPAAPALLRPVFAETIEQLRQIDGGLDMFRRLDGRVLIALDGSEYHCSRKIHCRHCSTRVRGNGGTEYFHSMLAATLVAPGHDKVIPLEPEFIVPQDGAEKQDCENMAAKRWLAAHAQRYAALDPVYLGDDLFSRQPLCQAVLDRGGHFIFVCKPSSHPLIQEYLTGADLPVLEQTVKRGKQRFVHRYRWLHDVPLRDGRDALIVNWFEIGVSRTHLQRKEVWSYTRDGGRPPEAGSQVQASNHCKLRPSKATVVSVAAKGGTRSRQVWSGEASESEPLMTCRNSMGDVKTGSAIFFRDQLGGGPEACLSGIRHIGGAKPDQALVWNVRTCRPDVKGEAQVAKTARA